MGLGILETRKLDHGHVPGTVYLGAGGTGGGGLERVTADELDPRLKYDTSGPKPIVLVPQPSDSPNDPLNWPLWKRDLITTVLCLISIMAATLSPLIAANTITLSLFWKRDFTEIALLTGYHLCGVGVAGLIFVPTARVYGRRHLLVLGAVLLVVSSAWGGASGSSRDKAHYRSFLWARVIQGVAVAPFEALVNAAVGDMYCVHQRGKRMAFTNFALYGGAFLTPVIVGVMTYDIGWRWTFYFVAIFSGILLPLVYLFVPETAYKRPVYLNTDITSDEHVLLDRERGDTSVELQNGSKAHPQSDTKALEEYDNAREPVRASILKTLLYSPVPLNRKKTFLQSLALFDGRKTDDSFLKLFIRPIPLLFHPAIFWGMITQGALIGWTVMIGVVLGALFMGSPLFFTEKETGYMYSGAFVGAIFGFGIAGILSDFIPKWLTKLNGGVYEPEFRIFLVIPQVLLGVIGVFGFGFSTADIDKYSWFWPSFFFGMEVAGMVLGAVASALYLVDAYRDIAVESFTCLLFFKNFFSFAMTWYAFDWLNKYGVWKLFWVVGVVQIAACLLSVPMYVFGKMNRAFMHRHDILKLLHLD